MITRIRITTVPRDYDPEVVHALRAANVNQTTHVTWCGVSVLPSNTENSSKSVTCLGCIAEERT